MASHRRRAHHTCAIGARNLLYSGHSIAEISAHRRGPMSDLTIYTVGHSNVSAEAFVALLRQHGITAVADVRSHPYSRYLPHFSQPALKATLREAGLHYVFLGREL